MRMSRLITLASQVEDLPILGPSFDGRADPLPHVSLDIKRDAIAAIEELIGASWLRSIREHPVRTLWSREDWLASLELVNLGILLRRIRTQTSETWWSAARKNLRSKNHGDVAGTAFEIVAASMLQSHGQSVELARPSQSGYDIALQTNGGGVLRISCKCLSVSDDHRNFKMFMDRLKDHVATQARPGRPIEVVMFRQARAEARTYDLPTIKSVLSECIRQHTESSSKDKFMAHGWIIGVRPVPPLGGAKFNSEETSYTFFGAQEHARDEQRRFCSKFEKAMDGLRNHCGSVSSVVSNAILVKLPQWINDEDARTYVRDRFASDSAHVSAAILFRTHVLSGQSSEQVRLRLSRNVDQPQDDVDPSETDRVGTNIGFMGHIIENSQATIPFATIAPHSVRFEAPFGQAIEQRPQIYFSAGDFEMPVERSYTYWRAEHSYRTDVDEQTKEVRMRPIVLAGASFRWRFFLHGEPVSPLVNIPSCPHDELVLL